VRASLVALCSVFGRLALVATFVLVAPTDAAADPAPPPAWTKIDDADGIAIYRREIPGSDAIAFKGEGIIAAPLVRVASVIRTTSSDLCGSGSSPQRCGGYCCACCICIRAWASVWSAVALGTGCWRPQLVHMATVVEESGIRGMKKSVK
jgi:hypothetical protein